MENEEKDYTEINLNCMSRILNRLSNLACMCEYSNIEELQDLVKMSIEVSHQIGLLQGLVDDVPYEYEEDYESTEDDDEDYDYD